LRRIVILATVALLAFIVLVVFRGSWCGYEENSNNRSLANIQFHDDGKDSFRG